MVPCQIIMVHKVTKQFRDRQQQTEIKHRDPWLGNHQVKFNLVVTPLRALKIKTIRLQRSKIVKGVQKKERPKIQNLNSLTFISRVKVAPKSLKDKVSKMTPKMASMIQKRLSIRKIKQVLIILKPEHQTNMKTSNRREAVNSPSIISNNKY